jgi:cbb3-type cytochrome oxidase maturation protein
MMPLGMWVVLGWMIFVAFTGIVFMIWGWKTGQFRDIEDVKYRMLEDHEPESWSQPEGGQQ